MEKKVLVSLLLGVFLLTILSSFVSAAVLTVTINTPSANAVVRGTLNVTVTVTNQNNTNVSCDVYAQSANTANSSWAKLTSSGIQNTTASIWNTTVNTELVEDGTSYIFNITCNNNTDVADSTSTGIIVDNTEPVTPSSLSPSDESTDADGDITFSATVAGVNTTACTLYFDGTHPGYPSYTMTHSANTCTYSATSVPDQTYNWYIRASDGSNTTDSSIYTVHSDVQTSAGKAALLAQQRGVKSKGGALLAVTDIGTTEIFGLPVWLIAVIIIIGIIVYINVKK